MDQPYLGHVNRDDAVRSAAIPLTPIIQQLVREYCDFF